MFMIQNSAFFLFQRRKIGKRNDLLFNFIFIMDSSLTFRILSSNAKWIKYLLYRPRVTQGED